MTGLLLCAVGLHRWADVVARWHTGGRLWAHRCTRCGRFRAAAPTTTTGADA